MDEVASRETATRLRVGIGAFKRRTQETLSEGDLTVPQLTALSRLDRPSPSTTAGPAPRAQTTPPAVSAPSRLDRLGPSTTAELARREQITPQAMGATIASLERRDLVARRPDAGD